MASVVTTRKTMNGEKKRWRQANIYRNNDHNICASPCPNYQWTGRFRAHYRLRGQLLLWQSREDAAILGSFRAHAHPPRSAFLVVGTNQFDRSTDPKSFCRTALKRTIVSHANGLLQ